MAEFGPFKLELPRLKQCNKCGAIYELRIDQCFASEILPKPSLLKKFLYKFWPNSRWISCGSLCGSSEFKTLTLLEELKLIASDAELVVYFLGWPESPNPEAWHQVSEKHSLEKI